MVYWNEEAFKEFKPSRWIQQGYPLSPNLFVMCIERLFQLNNVAVENKIWHPIHLSRVGGLNFHT
ncbi:hypothetical protein CR513_49109, partial [Mucuna pruriens]